MTTTYDTRPWLRYCPPGVPAEVAGSPAYLDAAFDEVRRRYGSFGAFLARGLDLDEQALRQLRDALAG